MCDRPPIPVVVNGATGKMGLEVIKAVANAEDMNLVGAIARNPQSQGRDIGELAGCGTLGVQVTNDLQAIVQEESPAVMVDFTRVDPTHPDIVYQNIRSAIEYGVRPVVGTTGLSEEQIQELTEFAASERIGCLIIPNFSIGMVLMQQAAIQAARFFKHVEIIERHHTEKVDAPSGTAIKTAQLLGELGTTFNPRPPNFHETVTMDGARGYTTNKNIRIHSVRLPGYIAHQEIIFGAPGEIYQLRHDVSDRSFYMRGVLFAIHKILELKSLVYGLENIDLSGI